MPRRSKRLLLRSTPAVLPSAHWISLGFNKRQADGFEQLQRDLLAGGRLTNANDGSVSLVRVLMGFGRELLPYHESILPHWGAFARTIKGRSKSLPRLNLAGIEITDAVWEVLSPMLHIVKCLNLSGMQITNVACGAMSQALHGVKCLDLTDCGMDSDGIRAVTGFLDGNSTLEELELGGLSATVRGFDSSDASFAFARAVKKHPTLRKLSTGYCNIGENAEIAKAIINGCENLEEVALVSENIGDECANELASMIRRNKNLRRIFLYWNEFTREGGDEIVSSVFDTSSLNAIIDCNHRAEIYLSSENDNPDKFLDEKMVYVNGSRGEVGKTVRYKVHRALFGPLDLLHWDPSEFSDDEELDMGPLPPVHFAVGPWKEMNVQYLKVLPVELAPRVFEFIRENKVVMLHEWDHDRMYFKRSWFEDLIIGRRRALDWVFQAMKSWCVPLAFGVVTV